MVEFDADNLFAKLEQVYVDRVVRNGFNDNHLYDETVILELSADDVDSLNDLGGIISKTTNMEKPKRAALLNASHMTPEQLERAKAARAKLRRNGWDARQLSPEERDALEQEKRERDARRKERDNRITILRGISLRIPLLIFGAELTDESEGITIDNFTKKIDDASWLEFMPRGVTKAMFCKFKKCYNPIVFTAAGKNIRKLVREADSMHLGERIQRITEIHGYFHNPDKETVLTPWRVVNMHMSDCLGGYCFFNERFDGLNLKTITKEDGTTEEVETNEPRYVFREGITDKVFGIENPRILEINSKTGLYPLYMTYSLYKKRFREYVEAGLINDPENPAITEEQVVWDDVVSNYIYVICNTPMAARITKRTLLGFREVAAGMNIKNEALIDRATSDIDSLVLELSSVSFWKDKRFKGSMKFNAIIGNPPYQLIDKGDAASDAAAPIYQKFVGVSKLMKPDFISMIMPSKWMVGGRSELLPFLEEMKADSKIVLIKDFRDDRSIFPSAHNDGGICYFLRNEAKTVKDIDFCHITTDKKEVRSSCLSNRFTSYVIRDSRVIPILEKVFPIKDDGTTLPRFSSIVSRTKPFGIRKDLFNNPENYPDSNLNVMPFDNSVRVFGVKGYKGGARRIDGFISRNILTDRYNAIDKYKIFFTTTYSSDATNPPDYIKGDILDTCTETFLLIGPFDSQEAMENCAVYMDTKFFKFLLYLGHGTMQVNPSVFNLIPLLPFDKQWDDETLFSHFSLDEDDVHLIIDTLKLK